MAVLRNYATEESRKFWMSLDKDLGENVNPDDYKPGNETVIPNTHRNVDEEQDRKEKVIRY